MRRLVALPVVLLAAASLAAPAVAAQARPAPAKAPARHVRVQLLGETELPNALQFGGTTVGGLSGISYDARTKQYRIISDDRSETNPARTYTARIRVAKGGVSVALTGTTPLQQPDGSVFPKTDAAAGTIAPDPEGIAVDPRHARFAWSSEGERILSPLQLADPTVRLAKPNGVSTTPLPTAPQLHVNAQDIGIRRNQAFEGLTYTPDGKSLWVGTEDPLYQDGDDPTPQHGALVRLTRHDARTGLPTRQVAYPLQPLFGPKNTAADTNGLSDFVSLGGSRFLVLERAFTTRDVVRIYEADASKATDVLGRDSLRSAPVRPVAKRLVVDLSKLKGLPRLDNVEGITLGPRLADGRRLLVLVSDDNFSTGQVTQFIALAASGI